MNSAGPVAATAPSRFHRGTVATGPAQPIGALLGASCLLLLSIEGLQVADLPATLRSISQAVAGGSPLLLASMASTVPAAIGALVAAVLV